MISNDKCMIEIIRRIESGSPDLDPITLISFLCVLAEEYCAARDMDVQGFMREQVEYINRFYED